MILFEKDFAEQGAIVYYDCPNKSFRRMSILLKQMGVQNNKFFLALYQPELRGVDPHSPDLTQEQIGKIMYECKINPWYFLYAVVRVPAQGDDGIPYILNRANLALMWVFFNSIDGFLTMPRQIGKTIGTMVLTAYIMYILGKNINIALFAKDNDLVLENVSRLKAIRDALPSYMVRSSTKDTNNKEGLKYVSLNNQYMTFVAQPDTKRAAGQGRGPSIGMEHWDELAWYTNNFLSYPAATSATDAAGEQIRAMGIPCANIITTTAGKLDDPRGEYAYGIRAKCMRFTEELYDALDNNSLNTIVEDNSENRMLYMEYSHLQLGKDDTWFRRVTRGKDPERVAMDYLNKWIHGSGEAVLTKEILDRLDAGKMEATKHTYFRSLILRWYISKEEFSSAEFKQKVMVLGQDTSDNVGRDSTTMVITDPENLATICTVKCNKSNLAYVAKCIYALLLEYPNLIYIPERNKNGAMMIDMILEMSEGNRDFNPFKRIYNTVVQEAKQSELAKYQRYHGMDYNLRKKFGFTTHSGANGRDMLYDVTLTAALDINADKVRDPELIDELNALTMRNGRIDHAASGHDDLTIAMLLACYLILRAKNTFFYGLHKANTLTSVNLQGESINEEELEAQREYRTRIKFLEEILKSTSSKMLRTSYEKELKYLKRKLKDSYDDDRVSSVGHVQEEVKQIKEEKAFGRSAADIVKAFYSV